MGQVAGGAGAHMYVIQYMPPWSPLPSLLCPRFIRFPGGCYVEGDRLANSFYWKRSIGPAAERPGHWNLWGYWSTDGATSACCLSLHLSRHRIDRHCTSSVV